VCSRAAHQKVPLYFYGGTPHILAALRNSLERKFPGILIAGMDPSKFRRLTSDEKQELVQRVRRSGASILFVGLGCPRQEVFAYEFRNVLSIPVLAVGAAFPFLAGLLPQAPAWMQDAGLEWLFRLACEPRRLWRSYVFLNLTYVAMVAVQSFGLHRFSIDGRSPAKELLYG
jgi:exopolysaccharide biosynthesis WecB/TagA/CpsF family protein